MSLSNNPAWIIYYISKYWKDFRLQRTAKVAFIDVEKMDKMGVLYDQSTTLAKLAGSSNYCRQNPQGIQYIHSSHWLVYGWTPPECVLNIVA